MKPKLLPWSVRGLNDGDKCMRVKNLLREWKVDTICFQETKLEVMSRSIVCNLWGCHHVDWCCLDFRGVSGGFLILWDRRVVEKINECVGVFSVAVTFRNVKDHFIWAFAGVYDPNVDRDRRLLWDELAGLF
jgi:exonuclease III